MSPSLLVGGPDRDRLQRVSASGRAVGEFVRRHVEAIAAFLGATILAFRTLRGVCNRLGHPGALIDDAYIHFQYARAIAEGHPLRYQAGVPYSSGATSVLWPAILAPFWAVGFRGEAILVPVWTIAFGCLALLAIEAERITRPLAGRSASLAAAALILLFGGYVWSAASGMEVLPFAWVLLRTARRSAEWSELRPGLRGRERRVELLVLAAVAPLVRPEGGIASVLAFAALAKGAADGRRAGRGWRTELAFSAGALVAPLLFPVVLRVLTGQFAPNTANVKLLFGNPYYAGGRFLDATLANARVLLGTLLEGEVWSAEFVPHGGAWAACAGLLAIAILGALERRYFRAGALLVVALGLFAPCTYVTFLWNRLRYLFPFASAWLVGLACLSRLLGEAAGWLAPRMRIVGPLAAALLTGLFAARLPGVFDDTANCAAGIDGQQVKVGRWIDGHLPADARIGLNDTGAIAYFGNRRTFDIVGLTTASEGRYWVGGAASRFEHYERLRRSAGPAALPTHFAVYREWFGCDALLGEELFSAHVEGPPATILGGQTMTVFLANYSSLDSGEDPWSGGTVDDHVDVADLDDESTHAYGLEGAKDGEQVVTDSDDPTGDRRIDGGRTNRKRERFSMRLPSGGSLIARISAPFGVDEARLLLPGQPARVRFVAPDDSWTEIAWRLDGVPSAETPTTVEVEFSSAVTSYHYWTVH